MKSAEHPGADVLPVSRRYGLWIAAVLVLLAGALIAWQHYRTFLDRSLSVPEGGLVFELSRGSGLAQVTDQLVDLGVVDQPLLLKLYGRLSGTATALKAGEYRLPHGVRPPELLALFTEGRTIQHRLTLVEGWSFREVMAALGQHDALRHTLEGLPAETVMERLGRQGVHPEGRFFPDTYLFPRGTTDLQLLRTAMTRMDEVVAESWAARERNLPYRDAEEALVMASIIEKETGLAAERADIAGVFVNRLRKGMKLQTDPTVIYGIGESFDGNLKRRHLREDTPYNTYVRTGLPPTPICIPGRAAIEAALHPSSTKALYFVARGDGSHQFSDTLVEHNAAVRRYQLKR